MVPRTKGRKVSLNPPRVSDASIAEIASEVDRWLETQRAEAHSRDRVNGHDGQDGTVVPRTKGQKASAGRAGRAGRAGNLAH